MLQYNRARRVKNLGVRCCRCCRRRYRGVLGRLLLLLSFHIVITLEDHVATLLPPPPAPARYHRSNSFVTGNRPIRCTVDVGMGRHEAFDGSDSERADDSLQAEAGTEAHPLCNTPAERRADHATYAVEPRKDPNYPSSVLWSNQLRAETLPRDMRGRYSTACRGPRHQRYDK